MDCSSVVLKSYAQTDIKSKNFKSKLLNPCFKEDEAVENLASCSINKSSEVKVDSKIVCDTLQYLKENNNSDEIRLPSHSFYELNQNAEKYESTMKNPEVVNKSESHNSHKLSIQSESLKFNTSYCTTDAKIEKKKQPFRYVTKINSSGDSVEDDNLSFKYVIKLPNNDDGNTHLKSKFLNSNGNKLNSNFSSELQKQVIFDGSKNDSATPSVNKFADCNNLTIKVNSVTNKPNNNATKEFKILENSHKKVIERFKESEGPKFKTDYNKFRDVKSSDQGEFSVSKMRHYHSDSKLLSLSKNKRALDNDNLTDLDYKKYQKKKNSFQKPYSKNFQIAVNSLLSSKNQTSDIQNCETCFKSCGNSSSKSLAANNAQRNNIEIIDLSSDSSSEGICFMDTPADKISSNIQMTCITNTSSKVDPKHNKILNSNFCEKILSNTKLSSNINNDCRGKSSTGCISHNPGTSISFQKDMHQNLLICSDSTNTSSSSYFRNEKILNCKSEVRSESYLPYQNKSISVEKCNPAGENMSINSTSNLNIEIQEINSCSDLDDSPSLIAPAVKVSKTSGNSTHFNNSTNLNARRYNNFSDGECSLKKTECCDKFADKMCNYNDLRDSESTPEDITEISYLPSVSTISHTRVIPEIIIEDDS